MKKCNGDKFNIRILIFTYMMQFCDAKFKNFKAVIPGKGIAFTLHEWLSY